MFSTDCPVKNVTSNEYAKCAGLWSVRCDDYKAHWVTTHNGSVVIQDPPLLYNINMDPSELHPIWPNNDQYAAIMDMTMVMMEPANHILLKQFDSH